MLYPVLDKSFFSFFPPLWTSYVPCFEVLSLHGQVKACLAHKDAEALRYQKLLMEEEEAAQNRYAGANMFVLTFLNSNQWSTRCIVRHILCLVVPS